MNARRPMPLFFYPVPALIATVNEKKQSASRRAPAAAKTSTKQGTLALHCA
jgi:hypothetical protein